MAYDAFISYSSESDRELAPAIRDALQSLARPWNKRRALSVFLDQSSLEVTSGLKGSLHRKLEETRWLVVLLSESSAASRWVNEEIAAWSATNSKDRLALVLTSGEIYWDGGRHEFDFERSTAVPEALRGLYAGDEDEPLWLDLRWPSAGGEEDQPALDLGVHRFRDAMATLAAPIHGIPKDELEGEDIRQHRRARRVRRAAIVSLAVLTAASVASALVAVVQQRRAVDAEERAVAERDRAVVAEEDAILQRDLAIAGQLAAASETLSQEATDLAILLALESVGVAETAEGRASLANAMAMPVRTANLGTRANSIVGVEIAGDTTVSVDSGGGVEVTRVSTTAQLGPSGARFGDSIVLTADGTTVATSTGETESAQVELWDLTSTPPHAIRQLGSPGAAPADVDVVSGRWALRTHDSVEIWTTEGVLEVELAIDQPSAVAFDPSGALLAATTESGVVRLWETTDWAKIGQLGLVPAYRLSSVRIGADGTVWFGGAGDGLFRWRAVGGTAFHPLWVVPLNAVLAIGPGPDVTVDATSCATGCQVIGDNAADYEISMDVLVDPTPCEADSCRLTRSIHEIDLVSDGSAAVVATGAGGRLWRADAGPGDGPTVLPGPGPLLAIAADERANGVTIVGGGAERALRQWTPADIDTTRDVVHSSLAIAIAASADGEIVASGDAFGAVVIADAVETRPALQVGETCEGTFDLAIDPTGQIIALSLLNAAPVIDFCGGTSRVTLRDLEGNNPYDLDTTEMSAIEFLPDGSLVLGTFGNGIVGLCGEPGPGRLEIWNTVENAAEVARDVEAAITAVDVSNDGRWIATSSTDGWARIYDADDLTEQRSHDAPGAGWALQVEFSHDSQTLAVSTDTGQILLVEVDDESRSPRVLSGHTGWVRGLAFTDDDRFLVSAGATDATIRFWDVASGTPIGQPYQMDDAGNDLVVGLDGRVVIASGNTGIQAILLCNFQGAAGTRGGLISVPVPSLSKQDACRAVGRNLTPEEWRLYRPDVEYQATCDEEAWARPS